MPSLMRPIAKALSTIAGPAGFPAEFAISLYDDEQAEKRFAALVAKISEGYALTKEAIEAIFNLKSINETINNQLIRGFQTILNILVENQVQLRLLVEQHSNNVDESKMADVILPLLDHNKDRLVKAGIVTEQALIEEFTQQYPDLELFLAVVYPAGFPQGIITVRMPPRVAYLNFVQTFRGLDRKQKATISKSLSKDKPGSRTIERWSAFYI